MEHDVRWFFENKRITSVKFFLSLYEYSKGKKILKFRDIEIEKQKFYSRKSAINIDDAYTDNIIISDDHTCTKGF